MSPEKDAAICHDFPHLFRDRSGSIMNSSMPWGFQCGDGWEPLIRETASKIEPIIVKMIDEAVKTKDFDALDSIPAASCVKEKYAILTWYMTYSTDEIDEILDEAVMKSAKTCEECGAKGKLRGKVWVYTACDVCYKKREAKRGQ